MSGVNSLFVESFGYEKPMLVCGFIALLPAQATRSRQAQASVNVVFKLHPNIKINAAVWRAATGRNIPGSPQS